MTTARKNFIDPASTPYFHCMARCVRRAFLCGNDKFSGKNYEHRRQWVVDRLKELANIFALAICAYAVMSNHYHVVLHINRGKVKNWDTREILHRWTQLFAVISQKLLQSPQDRTREAFSIRLSSLGNFPTSFNLSVR